jgi:hypothetical protein
MLRRAGLWATLALLLLSCERWLQSCLDARPCLGPTAGPRDWMALAVAAVGLLAATSGSIWLLRTVWLGIHCAREVSLLRFSTPPDHLRALAGAIGIRRIRFIDEDLAVAFCAGTLRPSVYVSRDLLVKLNQPELQAVVIHEAEHAKRFEPLRRAAWRAAAEVGFFVPLLGWARTHEIERSELRADRSAIDAIGSQAVASALWTLGSGPAPMGVAAYAGTIGLRVSQLLGDPLPRQLPRPDLLLSSLLGTAFALALIGCVAEIAGMALG